MTDLLAHVGDSIRNRRLLRREERAVVAVSGGLDSMVLLHVLHVLAVEQGWKLAVTHLNHQLRGRSSDADERLVRRTAMRLGLPMFVERATVKAFAKAHKLSLEMAARQVRHDFLARAAAQWQCRTVALAHHADDQVELFFLRLLRGAGGEGLQGMKWRSPSPSPVHSHATSRPRQPGWSPAGERVELIRPLLDVSRQNLANYAREQGIRFRDDASNASRHFLRNRLRSELLPLLRREYQPALTRTVTRLMEIVGAESAFVRETAESWLKAKRRGRFERLPKAVRRAVIRQQLLAHGVVPDFELVEKLIEAAHNKVSVDRDLLVWRHATGLVFVEGKAAAEFRVASRMVELKGRAGECHFGGLGFGWRITFRRGDRRPKRAERCEFFDAEAVGSPIILRHWQPGDRFQPIGLPQPAKLQDLLTNARIPSARRRGLVVALAANGRVFWVEGLRIGESFKLTAGTSRRLQWCWKRPESAGCSGFSDVIPWRGF